MPRLLAASISMRSSVVPSRIDDARRAAVARVAVLEVRAVDGLGQDPGERGLAGAARPDEQDGVADAVGADGVAERLDDGFLADDLAERLGAPAPVERLVRDGRGHGLLRSGRAAGPRMRKLNCRAPSVDQDVPVPTMTSGSDQAVPRHPTMIA